MWILARGVRKIGPLLIVHATIYDKEDSALKRLEPMGNALFNKFNKAEANVFEAEHGMVKNIAFACLTFHHKYNSRYFHEVLFQDLYKEEKGEANEKTS